MIELGVKIELTTLNSGEIFATVSDNSPTSTGRCLPITGILQDFEVPSEGGGLCLALAVLGSLILDSPGVNPELENALS